MVVKYGGSALWALTIYWFVSALLHARGLATAAAVAGIIATTVELAKLYHSPALDAFRLTLPGILLLGRIFSVWDIVAYWAAIISGVLIDMSIETRTNNGAPVQTDEKSALILSDRAVAAKGSSGQPDPRG